MDVPLPELKQHATGSRSRIRSSTGDSRYWSDYDKTEDTLLQATLKSIYVPFRESFSSSSTKNDDGAVLRTFVDGQDGIVTGYVVRIVVVKVFFES